MPAHTPDKPTHPGGNSALMVVAHKPDRVFTHGQGDWLFDDAGRRHLDWVQGWAVNSLGHAPPAVARALAQQAGRLLQAGPGFHNQAAQQLAHTLRACSGLDRCFFTSSGAEANEGAIKLARKFGQLHRGGAFEIITFEHSFHGRTLATMSASGKPGFDTLFAPQVPGFRKARLNDLASVQALHTADTVAVLVEPIQGEAGVVAATPAFLQALRAWCDQHGLLLMFDEVQTGVGRTGELWGHSASGVRPDVMTLGKGLGGGVPIGALLAREAVCCFAPGDQGGTYNGNPLVCAAASAVLNEVLAEGFLPRVQHQGRRLHDGLISLARRWGGSVHGRGLLLAWELPWAQGASEVAHWLLNQPDAPMLVNPVRPARLRFMPALTLSDEALSLGLERLALALAACAPQR